MQTTRPAKLIDPVCGMTVDVDRAEAEGLLLEHIGRTYAFCRAGCRRAFEEDPHSYISNDDAPVAAAASGAAESAGRAVPLTIDEGMRRWYESCSCCLSDAYPEVKAQLDAERLAHAHEPAGPGICEVAEAG
jgi:YHS domain-containing protein